MGWFWSSKSEVKTVNSKSHIEIDANGNIVITPGPGAKLIIGNKETGIDYILEFDGETTTGKITYDEGMGEFVFDQKIRVYATSYLQLIYPRADDTYYLGKNSSTTPAAWKGLILKDTTNGNYYRIEVISGVVTATLL
jgi:hypothetical protein